MIQTRRLRDPVVLRIGVLVITLIVAVVTSAQPMPQAPTVDPAEMQRRMQEELVKCQLGEGGDGAFDEALCETLLGLAALSAGRGEAGVERIRGATETLEAAGDALGRSSVNMLAAEALAQLGDSEASERFFDAAVAAVRRLRESEAPINRQSLEFFARFGGVPENFIDQLESMLGIARPMFLNQLELQILLRRVQHQLRSDPAGAEPHLEKARELSGGLMGLFDAQVFDFYGQLREKQGRVEEAVDFYRRAATAARSHRDEVYAERLERRVEALERDETKAPPPEADDRPEDLEEPEPHRPEPHRPEPVANRADEGVAAERESACAAESWPFGAARSELEEELRLAREDGDRRREAQVLVLLSDEALGRGEFGEAAAKLDQALPFVTERADPWGRAELLAQKAGLAHRLARLSQAEEFFERALRLARELPPEIQDCGEPVYVLLASRFMAGKFDWSELAARKTAPLAFASITRLAYGRLLHELRRPEDAAHHLKRVLEASSRIGPSLDAQAHYLLGAVEARRGHSEDAKKNFRQALAAMGGEECSKTSSAFPMTCFETLADYADLVAAVGESARALELSTRALEAAESYGDPVQVLNVLSRRCSLFPRFGDNPSRVEIWEEGEEILGQLPEEADHVTASIYVSVMATCAGFQENALAHVLRAEERLGDAISPEYEHLFSSMRLTIRSSAGDWSRAGQEARQQEGGSSVGPRARALERNSACWRQIQPGRQESKLDSVKALVACMAESDSRFAQIDRELESFTSGTSTDRWLKLMDQVVELFPESQKASFQELSEGIRQQEAEDESSKLAGTLRKMVADCHQRGNPGFSAISHAYSQGLLSTPNRAMALVLAEERLAAGEKCLREARLDETFLRHAEQSRLDFEVLATLQARQGLYAEAFATAERARAFSLMRWLGRPGPDLRATADAELYSELEASKVAIGDLQAKLDQADPGQAKSLRASLEEQREQQDDLLLRLKLTASEYSELAANQVVDLPRVQQALEEGVVLVSYFTMADQTLAWIIERDAWRHVVLPVERETLESKVREMRRWLELDRGGWAESRKRGGALVAGDDAMRGRESAMELYRHLIESLDLDRSKKRLLLVPHGALQRLPFAALQDPSTKDYLVQHFSLSILPSAGAVIIWQDGGEPGGEGADGENSLVLGDPRSDVASLDPLPHAGTEARRIARLLGVEPRVGEEARESLVREKSAELSLLAIAAHGVQDSEDPRRSFLALAADAPGHFGSATHGSATHDGRLEMGEIFDEVRFTEEPLVVLSACETGLGRRAGGDEIEGFIRAFLFAGAGAVAATLWRIDDEASSELMQSFFGSLQDGRSAAEALQQAQLQLLKDPRFAAPYFWAGFSITGNPAVRL